MTYGVWVTADETSKPSRARRGRRPGESGTRQAILEAARARFATDGYAAATIRKIAADAGVDAALVMRFYRSKDDLFAAVMAISPEALDRIAQAFEGPEQALGERVTRACLALWEGDPQDAEAVTAMLRAALSSEQAAAQLRGFIQARLVGHLSPRLHGEQDATLRAGLATSMLIGVIVGRRIVGVPALIEADLGAIIRRVAPAIQTVLTMEADPDSAEFPGPIESPAS